MSESFEEGRKSKIVRLLIVISILALSLVFNSGNSLQARNQEFYLVGSDIAWPPFEWVDENGNPVGFDMDLVRCLAIIQDFEVKFKDIAFDALIPTVNAKKIDLIVAGMTITKKRAQKVDFSDPYWFSDLSVLVHEDSNLNIVTALSQGHTVGAQRGTTGAGWVKNDLITKGVNVELKLYDTLHLAELDLLNKRIDTVIKEETVAAMVAANNPLKVVGKIITGEAFGMAVPEGDPLGLLPKINAGLKKVRARGIYDNLKRAYFGVGTELDRITKCYGEYKHFLARDDPGSYARNLAYCMGKKNRLPVANFTPSSTQLTIGQSIIFDASGSFDPDGEITKWHWDFGDGSTSDKQNPTHQYRDNGTYTVKLTVTDNQGATDTAIEQITVKNAPPRAVFNFSPFKPIINAPVTFDASTSSDPDGKIEQYQWEFGDGSTKTGEKVSHTYTSEGKYKVKLTVTDDDGDTDYIQKEIQVSAPPPKIKKRYGIVIGISDYKYADDKTCPGFCDLKYPAQDAKAFYNLLVNENVGAFPQDNVTLLIDDKATVSAIKSAFSRLIAEAGEDDLVVIYYSGHGGQGPDLNNDEGDGTDEYYIAYDTKPKDADKLFASGIRDDEFGDWLNSLRSKQVTILLDSCYSGGATKNIKGTSPPDYKAGPNNSVFNDFSFEDRFLLSASQENQVSFESEELGHGVFTHFLLEGLKGKADLDQDGEITSEEVYEYVKPKVNEYVTNKWPGYSQIPFSKGAVTAAVVSKQRVLKGKITAIEEEKKQAGVGEHVSINLGKDDGVEVGDIFEVYHIISSKGVVLEEVRGRIEVIEVPEPHRSLCKVIELKYPIEVEDEVRKMISKEENQR